MNNCHGCVNVTGWAWRLGGALVAPSSVCVRAQAPRALTLDDLQPVTETGYAPSEAHEVPVSTSGLSGRHVVCTIRQASHMDQTYLLCSDVNCT